MFRSSSGSFAIRYVLPVLWMTSCLHLAYLPGTGAPDSAGGAYSAAPGSLAGFKGPTSKGESGGDGREKGRHLHKKFAFGRVAPEICLRTDRQTHSSQYRVLPHR